MTNKQAIEVITHFDKHIIPCDEYGYRIDSDLMEAHLMAAKALRNEWIPVTERLPEDDLPKDSKRRSIKVLVCYKTSNGVPVVRTQVREFYHRYSCKGWGWAKVEHITHWMPLPEPPREENTDA